MRRDDSGEVHFQGSFQNLPAPRLAHLCGAILRWGLQNLGPTLDSVNQNLHCNKIPVQLVPSSAALGCVTLVKLLNLSELPSLQRVSEK